MINVNNVSKVYIDEYVFKNINFTIQDRDRIAIVGNNGVGKTTLMKCIIDDNFMTDGEILKDKGKIGYLSQDIIEDFENTVQEEYDIIFKELVNIEKKMKHLSSYMNNDEEKILEYGILESKYMYLGGYEKERKVDIIMQKFGFSKKDIKRKIKEFSGGQITKLALIKLLLLTPDYLLLDEPTNHLDIETITWLEDYLKSYPGAIVMISHDRYFIDKVANKIVDIQNQTCEVYNTNFTNYLNERKLRYNIRLSNYENQQQEIKKYQEFIEKFRGKPSKTGQVNDRKSKLARMNIIEKPAQIKERVNFTIDGLNVKKAYYIDMIHADIGYSENEVLIRDFNLRVLGGEKLAIIGANGVGKTTLLKTILKEIEVINGKSILHHSINIGYFSQMQNYYDENLTIYDYIFKYMPENSATNIRKYLARFLFKQDDVHKQIKNLSGGEKVRLTLAIFTLEKYDMIVLDEPTNHLDFETKQILQNAIKDYEGTVLCVSHDRYFLDKIVDKYIYLTNKDYHIYKGTYKDCEKYIFEKLDMKSVKNKKENIVKQKQTDKKLRMIEREIEKLEIQKDEMINLSMEKEIYSDYVKAKELNEKIVEVEKLIDEKYQEYETM